MNVYEFLFFAIPAGLVALFCAAYYRYKSAKEANEEAPGTYSDQEIRRRRLLYRICCVMAGVLAAVVVGVGVMLCLAIAYM